MDIILVTTVIASLFVVIGIAEPFAARVRLPYSVILAVLGILIGAGATFFLPRISTAAPRKSRMRGQRGSGGRRNKMRQR